MPRHSRQDSPGRVINPSQRKLLCIPNTNLQTNKHADQQIKGNSIRNYDFCKVNNFCQEQPSPGRQTTSYTTDQFERETGVYHSVNTLLVAAAFSCRVINKAEKQCDKASPFSRPFFIGKLSDQCLFLRNLLLVSFKHRFINLRRFISTPNPVKMLYKTSFLPES